MINRKKYHIIKKVDCYGQWIRYLCGFQQFIAKTEEWDVDEHYNICKRCERIAKT